MEGFKDYKVLIEDLEVPEKDLTKAELIGVINKEISKGWSAEFSKDAIEIEVEPEWKNILREDGSILYEYTQLGWKAMHYQQRDQEKKIKREWLSFKSLNYKGKKK